MQQKAEMQFLNFKFSSTFVRSFTFRTIFPAIGKRDINLQNMICLSLFTLLPVPYSLDLYRRIFQHEAHISVTQSCETVLFGHATFL